MRPTTVGDPKLTTSRAINEAVGALHAYSLPRVAGGPGALEDFLGGLLTGTQRLHLADEFVALVARIGVPKFQKLIATIVADSESFEHLAAQLGTDALYRAETGLNRFGDVAGVVPASAPPELSKKYLSSAVACYLLALDDQCVAMCRGALEVLVEQLLAADEHLMLGKAIRKLTDDGRISAQQAADMWQINDQAKEVLHAAPGPQRPDALDCLQRLGRLLGALHPAAERPSEGV